MAATVTTAYLALMALAMYGAMKRDREYQPMTLCEPNR